MLRKILPICAAVMMLALVSGCEYALPPPPQVTFSTIQPSGNPAKPPDCTMPVLHAYPSGSFREVALIDALGNVYSSKQDVTSLVKRQACETGADAIVITVSRRQVGTNNDAYYVGGVAIVYGKKHSDATNNDAVR